MFNMVDEGLSSQASNQWIEHKVYRGQMPVNSNEQQMKNFHPFLNYQKHQIQMESSIQNSEIHIIEDTNTYER